MTETDATPPAVPASAPRRWDWRPKVRWFTAEYLIVVLGVLTAVAMNAWWGERSDRAQEQQILAQILDDVRQNHDELTRDDFPGLERQHVAQGSIVATLYGAGPVDEDALLERFASVINSGSRFYPQTAAYESLKSTGVDLIEDDSLRIEITDLFERWLKRVEIAEDDLWNTYDRDFDPYIMEHFLGVDSMATAEGTRRSVAPRDLAGVRADPAFKLILWKVRGDRVRLLRQYAGTERRLEALIERLEAEIEG